jgi:small-conductance mechanosensitive channel
MERHLDKLTALLEARALELGKAAVVLVLAALLVRALRQAMTRGLATRLEPQHLMLARTAVTYAILGLALTWALKELGFDPGVLLGAAGVLTVALGFASQTAVSNLISGLFLIAERPFVVGDTITVDTVTGQVLSIDLLSVKLRTADNLYVRVPTEQMLKSRVTTVTRFPIRRFDLNLGVPYHTDLDRLREVLMELAAAERLILEEPAPLYALRGFGASTIDVQFSVWAKRESFFEVRNLLMSQVKKAFESRGLELSVPPQPPAASTGSPPLEAPRPVPRGAARPSEDEERA